MHVDYNSKFVWGYKISFEAMQNYSYEICDEEYEDFCIEYIDEYIDKKDNFKLEIIFPVYDWDWNLDECSYFIVPSYPLKLMDKKETDNYRKDILRLEKIAKKIDPNCKLVCKSFLNNSEDINTQDLL